MALITCPECKKKISENAESCPKCGYTLTPEIIEGIKTKEKKDKKISRIFWLSLIAVIIIIFTYQQKQKEKYVTENEVSWEQKVDKVGAYLMAENFVKKSLKSPSTAEFTLDVLSKEESVIYLGNQKYRVSYYVDSQNGFGAMVRTNFVCEVERYEENMWRLLSLEFDE